MKKDTQQYKRAWKQRKLAQGLCRNCGKKPIKEGLKNYCEECAFQEKERHRRQYHDAINKGLCGICRKRPKRPSLTNCEVCAERKIRRERQAKMDGVCASHGLPMMPGGVTCLRCKEINRRQHLKRTYGITTQHYDALFDKQGGACGICGTKNTGKDRNLCVDHCHKTGIVRGLLCKECNVALGKLGDTIEDVEKVLTYLKEHQSTGRVRKTS